MNALTEKINLSLVDKMAAYCNDIEYSLFNTKYTYHHILMNDLRSTFHNKTDPMVVLMRINQYIQYIVI